MLNTRLYRTSWLVVAVAMVVALLTLEPPEPGPEPALPVAFDGAAALELNARFLEVAPTRPAGSPASEAAAQLVREELASLPGAEGRVVEQRFEARVDGSPLALANVYLAVPGDGGAARRGGVVVVAPRDTPPGVSGGASSTAVLLRLALLSSTTAHARPHLFVSTDGGTVGGAGLRWFLTRFSEFPIAAVVVLDAPGEAEGPAVHLWSNGPGDERALGLRSFAQTAVGRAGGRPEAGPGLGAELLRLAAPGTSGGQAAAIAAGIPGVTISGRPDTPLPGGLPAPSAERLTLVGDATNALLAALDVADPVPGPAAAIEIAGQTLRPTVARLCLALLAFPVLALAIDGAARMRRAQAPLIPGLRALARRAAPMLAVLVAAYAAALAGLISGPAAGLPPLPSALPFDAAAGLGLALALAAGALTWLVGRRRGRRGRRASPDAEAAAAILVLGVALAVAWWLVPFALVLALPAAHAGLVATAARRRWQVGALALVAALPALALLLELGGRLGRDPIFATWYLLGTAANGSQGAAGPLLAVAVTTCVAALGALVAFRAQKGLLPAGGAPGHRGRRAQAHAAARARARAARARRRGHPPPRRGPGARERRW